MRLVTSAERSVRSDCSAGVARVTSVAAVLRVVVAAEPTCR